MPTGTAVGSGTATTSVLSLGAQPAAAKFIIAVADSPNADPDHTFVSVAPPSDVGLDSSHIVYSGVNSSANIEFTYHTVNNPKTFTVGLYRSPTPSFNISQDTLLQSQTVTPAANSSSKGSFNLTFAPNPNKPYLLVVVNPPDVHFPKQWQCA